MIPPKIRTNRKWKEKLLNDKKEDKIISRIYQKMIDELFDEESVPMINMPYINSIYEESIKYNSLDNT